MTIIYFIIALSSLVLIHEWGHFFIARRSGIRVEVFSIGFGPKLFSLRRGETEYRFSALPFGGYVKLFGEDPVSEAEGDEAKAREIAASPEAFSGKPIFSRLLTVLAGPGMNLVLALVVPGVLMMSFFNGWMMPFGTFGMPLWGSAAMLGGAPRRAPVTERRTGPAGCPRR